MPVPGRYHRSIWGPDELVRAVSNNNGAATFAMAALNTGCCWRFTAPDTRDVAGVWLNFSAVTAAGTVRIRIETIDATTGKPSGTLYDASATLDITPVVGWQQCTFAALPTVGLVPGNEYGIVLLTTVAGTTMTLRYQLAMSSYPTAVLTAADGTLRTNFAESATAIPCLTLVFEDGSEEALACSPYATTGTANAFLTQAAGLLFSVPTGLTLSVAGIEISNFTKNGAPAGDLRLRIFDGTDAAVAGTTVTANRISLNSASSKRVRVHFPAPVSLPAGTYRVVLDSASSANNSNSWGVKPAQARVAANAPSGFQLTTTADVTATPIVWTNTPTDVPPMGLILDDAAGTAGTFLVEEGLMWQPVTTW